MVPRTGLPSSRDAPEDGSIVVPAAASPSPEACLRSLAPRGVHTIVVSEDPRTKSFRSTYCDEAVLVPDPTTDLEGYAEALLALAGREDVRTIVPTREEEAFVLSARREAFADRIATPWPTLEGLRRVHDRVELAAAAEAAGVPVPETTPLADVENRHGPSIVKSRYNLLVDAYVDAIPAGTVARNKTVEHLGPGDRPDVGRLRSTFGHDPIVQEFVPIEREYMVGALCDRGEILASVQHEQLRGASYTGGGGVYRESTYVPALEEVAAALLEELEWHGLACLEYMRHPETGEFYLAEINPRMWTSLAANVRMGADFPYYYWQLATGHGDRIEPGYELGVGCHYLKGELSYVLSLLGEESPLVDRPPIGRTLLGILASCYRQPNADVLSRDDPWPFVQDVLTELEGITPDGLEPAALGSRIGRPPVDWREAAGTSPGPDRRERESTPGPPR